MSRKLDRRERFVASCNYCGTFLQETQSNCKCNVVCSGCGRNMAVVVRKGKVTVFEERHDDDPVYKDRIRMISYVAGLKRLEHESSKMVAESGTLYEMSVPNKI
ncbi:hypothetical protein [Oribacterium sp. P6A1]|uniref:hypothetical protein n=1 Tax=Oribacterium sp. P6A1 TaxID=1410612 RepID=UPI0012DD7414|nr:hypothetical protein [Oribacterium sp. P6A1]